MSTLDNLKTLLQDVNITATTPEKLRLELLYVVNGVEEIIRHAERYVHSYETCPRCGCSSLTGDRPLTGGEDTICQTVECNRCSLKWVEVYTYSHSEDENGDPLDSSDWIIE